MFQKLEESTGRSVGIRISGTVKEEDYERLLPELEYIIDEYGEVNLLCQFDGFSGIEPAALWEDLKFDVAHFRDISRCAIVKDQDWQGWLGRLAGPFTGVDVKVFEPGQVDEAWGWVRRETAQASVQDGHTGRQHARAVRGRLHALAEHLRDGVNRVEDPRAEALFETTAEVLRGLETAFEHYEKRAETAWREG